MKPFKDKELSEYFEKNDRLVDEFIENEWIADDVIMTNDIDLLVNHVYEAHYVIPITLFDEDKSKRFFKKKKIEIVVEPRTGLSSNRTYAETDGLKALFYYPFTGEQGLFEYRSSTISTGEYPEIFFEDNYVVIVIEKSLDEMKDADIKQKFQELIDNSLRELNRGISFVNKDIDTYNLKLKKRIRLKLQEKKDNVSAFYKIAEMFEVPIEKTEQAKTLITVTRKIVPLAHKHSAEKSYYISDENYADILSFLKHTASTYERTPSSYRHMLEEDLRNTLLAALNGIFKGNAMGEAFRNTGKTDICIETENRAAFVAECKMWTGPRAVGEAILQLDRYLTWRDCKAALIFFVRNKDFISVLSKAKDALKNFLKVQSIEEIDKNEFKIRYTSQSNPNQTIQIRVLLFNLYFDDHNRKSKTIQHKPH